MVSCNGGLPINVAISLGLLISKCSIGKFKDHLISFHTTPSITVLNGDDTLRNRVLKVSNMPWGGSTDLIATFKLILDKAIQHELKQEDMPKRLWIISDMQFNAIDNGNLITNYQKIDEMYNNSIYTRPQIIFWNVDGSTSDYPVSVDDNGTAMISGFSPSIMKSVLSNNTDFSPYNILRTELDGERLKKIAKALEYQKKTRFNPNIEIRNLLQSSSPLHHKK